MKLKKQDIAQLLEETSLRTFGCHAKEATEQQMYKTLCITIRDLLSAQRKAFTDEVTAKEKKQVYYMSMEFLVGTSLRNNLFNLGLEQNFKSVLKDWGVDLNRLYEM